MKLVGYFSSFLADTVNLNQSRLDDLNERVPRIVKALEEDPELGDKVLDSIPQGSWAHRTIIRPAPDLEFDADVLIQLEEVTDWDSAAAKYSDALWSAIRSNSTYRDMATLKDRCVRITYANDCHIDLVPYVITSDGRQLIIERRSNSFEATNPTGFTEWIQEKDDVTGGDLRRVIRLLKYLRDHRSLFAAKSIILTTLVGQVVESWRDGAGVNYYRDVPTTLVNVVEDLDAWLQARATKPSVVDPSAPATNFDHRWTDSEYQAFRTAIHRLAPRLRSAYDATTVAASCEAWQGVFGESFKRPDEADASNKSLKPDNDPDRAPREQFIEDLFPVEIRYRAELESELDSVTANRRVRRLRARAGRLPIGPGLKFRLVYTDAPLPYAVYWKVRNRGDEARRRGQERGEVKLGSSEQTETSSFAGPHYVECFIIKDQTCVARARIPVNIDTSAG